LGAPGSFYDYKGEVSRTIDRSQC